MEPTNVLHASTTVQKLVIVNSRHQLLTPPSHPLKYNLWSLFSMHNSSILQLIPINQRTYLRNVKQLVLSWLYHSPSKQGPQLRRRDREEEGGVAKEGGSREEGMSGCKNDLHQ